MSLIWDSEFGQQVLHAERQPLASLARRLHGETVLWVGTDLASAQPLQRCMTRNPTVLLQDVNACPGVNPDDKPVDDLETGQQNTVDSRDGDYDGDALPRAVLVGDACELPFKSNSVDGIVLHHALECVDDPRIALREAVRVLNPGGRLIVCGFNPFSMIGVQSAYCRAASRFIEHPLGEHRLVNPIRMFDWFALLGLDLDRQPHYFAYTLPFRRLSLRGSESHRLSETGAAQSDEPNNSETSGADAGEVTGHDGPIQSLRAKVNEANLPFAGLLVVSAVKQAITLRPKWRKTIEQRKLAPVAYPSVASWRRAEDWPTDPDR